MPALVKSSRTRQPRRSQSRKRLSKFRRRALKKKAKSKAKFRFLKIAVFAIVFFSTLVFISLNTEFWDGKSNLNLVINKESGEVILAVFDPEVGEIVNISIPGNTQVNVSRQLGTWKMKSVWQLGINEGLVGALLAETVTRHFKLPVVAWANSPAEGFVSSNPTQLVKAIFIPYKTNLKIGDRVRLALFSLGVEGTSRVDINLVDTSFLRKTRLTDGGEGFIAKGTLPQKLLVIFADSEISRAGTKVVIKDASSVPGLAEEVGAIIEVLGAKVVSVSKEQQSGVDCEISGKEKDTVEKIARLFSCKVSSAPLEGSLDLQILLGEDFAKRY